MDSIAQHAEPNQKEDADEECKKHAVAFHAFTAVTVFERG